MNRTAFNINALRMLKIVLVTTQVCIQGLVSRGLSSVQFLFSYKYVLRRVPIIIPKLLQTRTSRIRLRAANGEQSEHKRG